mmetsp:Transcript_22652/g.29406  ORF Transcript_22652/g.29406 Transcript_22652/m.29406 type:complete len:206 (-) Transcript_22652:79-696(-)|eukprot:CAMPEP_0117736422 /NCGR_PEP_ID=MMETSP0947-20121206/1920_1 /TAXON_ID=44440 /ORGANISM="Chattonella subsalsa, Strain CCMP2191" /LENGTH=205 /DNA_ID=CAMNT_0005551709 /DNA_START=113 /DNA_END=730 /DNA_ORIENTATION=+
MGNHAGGLQEGMLTRKFGIEAKKMLTRKRTKTKGENSESVEKIEVATFAAGSFWGLELAFQRVPGVLKTQVGFAGGHIPNPSYQLVCTGITGHTEAVQIEFDSELVSFQDLLTVFWDGMDPTFLNRQGPNTGTQYRSVIYYNSDEQRQIAEVSKAMEQQRYEFPIVTEIVRTSTFWPAESYHQNYLAKQGQSAGKGDVTPIKLFG